MRSAQKRSRPRRHASHELRSRWWWVPPFAIAATSLSLFVISMHIAFTGKAHHAVILLLISLLSPVGVLLVWASCMRTSRKKRQ